MPNKKKKLAEQEKTSPRMAKQSGTENPEFYTLKVLLLSRPISRKFASKTRGIFRTIEIRGDQTLEDLHHAIFEAFDRFDEHMYEFQFGNRPMDPDGPRYVLPEAFEPMGYDAQLPAGVVSETTIDSLRLEEGRLFGYWFDFGDDWWHQIEVVSIEPNIPPGEYPKITKRVGQSPPQYPDADDE